LRRDSERSAINDQRSTINETNYTPMLHVPLRKRFGFIASIPPATTATFKALDSDFSVKIPAHPFSGCIGVAPANGEARTSEEPAEFGGNMDSPEASVGNTVYFPVNVKAGLFYIGNGHAAMGDGEIAGTAVEVPLQARLPLSLIPGGTISWPQFENDDALVTVGAYRPVDDAVPIAFTELVHWIQQDYGLTDLSLTGLGLTGLEAYELPSKPAKIHLNRMVDPNYVVVASMEKKYLSKKKQQLSLTQRDHNPHPLAQDARRVGAPFRAVYIENSGDVRGSRYQPALVPPASECTLVRKLPPQKG
jgi:hypothetical protein